MSASCSTCGTHENLRYMNRCVDCDRAERRQQRAANHSREVKRAREWEMTNWYGISLEERDRMAEEQDDCCKVCGKREGVSAFGIDRLQVEHCHTCGAVRGLTCRTCNGRVAHHEQGNRVPEELLESLDDYIDTGCMAECTTRILVGLRYRLRTELVLA